MEWGRDLYADADAAKYVDGLAFHWYAGGLIRDLDGAVAHYTVDTAFAQFPDAKLLPSEGCNCPGVKDSDLLRAARRPVFASTAFTTTATQAPSATPTTCCAC